MTSRSGRTAISAPCGVLMIRSFLYRPPSRIAATCSRSESRKRWSTGGRVLRRGRSHHAKQMRAAELPDCCGARLFEVEHLLDRVDELDRPEGLQQVIGRADGPALRLVRGLVMRAEHHDGNVSCRRVALQGAAHIEAVVLEPLERHIE